MISLINPSLSFKVDSLAPQATGGTQSTLSLFNTFIFTDNTHSVTPYFRNYLFSRRDTGFGGLIGPLFGYRHSSKSSKWRLRFLQTWSANNLIKMQGFPRRSVAQRGMFGSARTALSLFRRVVRGTCNPYVEQWFILPVQQSRFALSRIWGGAIRAAVGHTPVLALGLLRRIFFKSWVVSLVNFSAILAKFVKVVYSRLMFNLPYRFSAVGFDSGAFSSLGSKRFAYGSWHSPYSKQTKFYKRKRLMITRYARILFGFRRTRFVKKICKGVPHSAINRVHTFSVMFHSRLVTFVSLFFNINSHTRTLLLIRMGHVFVNGQCVRNPDFSLTTHDAVSFSQLALTWLQVFQNQQENSLPFIASRARRQFVGAWKPRVFQRSFEKAIVFGPLRQFAVIRHSSALPLRPFRRKLDSNPFFSNKRIRFLLGTLSF